MRVTVSTPALILAGALTGVLFTLVAYSRGPLVVPFVLIALALVVAAMNHRGVAVAVAVALIPLGPIAIRGFGLLEDVPPYLPGTLGAMGLATLGFGRALADRYRVPLLAPWVFAYGLACCLSVLLVTDTGYAAQALRFVAVGVLLFLGVAWLIRERTDLVWLLRGLAGIVTVIGVLSVFGGPSEESAGAFVTTSGELVDRTSAGFSHPNALGGFLVVLVPSLIAGALLDRPWRGAYALAIVLGAAAIYLSFSRGALLGLALAPILFVPRRRALILVPIFALAVVLAAPDLLRERFTTLTGAQSDFAARLDFWEAALALWSNEPLFGVGLGGFADAYAGAPVSDHAFLPGTVFQPPPHAHNLFLNHLAELGLVGLILFSGLLVAALRLVLRLRRLEDRWLSLMGTAMLATLAVFLVHNQFDVTIFGETGEVFWVFIGLIAALAGIAARASPGPVDAPP
jgi:O-antigen ligase